MSSFGGCFPTSAGGESSEGDVTGLIDTNTLVDPFIRTVLGDGGSVTLSLPGVLAACASADPNRRAASFPALRAHQAPAFHAFLAQICAMGLLRLGRDTLPGADEDAWREVFRVLTRDDFPDDEPWWLVSPHDRPALLQPPVPEGNGSGFSEVRTPDGIDILFASKHHDLKDGAIANAQADDWIFALLSVQTQDGYPGRGNFGVARMNSGSGSRSYIHLAPDGGFAVSVLRDIERLLSQDYDRVPPDFVGARAQHPLVWVLPWDGASQVSLEDLDPLFVEICRRWRLARTESGEFVCLKTPSQSQRINAKDLCGVLGDPWAPVNITAQPNKVLTLQGAGFTYLTCAEILFGDVSDKRQYRKPYLLVHGPGEKAQDMLFVARALTRGQSKTEGFHSRTIPVPAQTIDWWESQPADASSLVRDRIEAASDAWSKALRGALFTLAQGGREDIKWKEHKTSDALAGAMQARFDARVDAVFFPALWDAVAKSQNERERDWAVQLRDIAREIFDQAVREFSVLGERRFLAEARARLRLEGGFCNAFSFLKTNPGENPEPIAPYADELETAS
jgi:CRISPR system Cascade subunit CasA